MKNTRSIGITAGLFLLLLFNALPAQAGNYDIKNMTPAIQQALNNRQARYAELQRLKSSGQLVENSRGYVDVLQGGGNAGAIASQENADRGVIYQAIVEQNNLGAGGLSQVESVFAEVQREKSRRG